MKTENYFYTRVLVLQSFYYYYSLTFFFSTGEKLVEANQEQQFNRSVDDVELWLAETESHLESTDLGKVNFL